MTMTMTCWLASLFWEGWGGDQNGSALCGDPNDVVVANPVDTFVVVVVAAALA